MGIKLKKIAKVISTIIFWFLIAIIIFLLGYVLLVRIYTKQDRLEDIPINFYTIVTQSMANTIMPGDIVITYKTKDDIYKENDIITFVSESNSSKGVTITHRIIDVNYTNDKYYYKTKGDANNTADFTPVSQDSVIGKVVLTIPKAGYLQQFLVSKFGWLIAVVLPCLGIIIYDIMKIIKNMLKSKKQEKFLTSEKTVSSKEDLNDILEDKYVSSSLQEKIDNVYDVIGVDVKKDEVEVLEYNEEKKEVKEDDTEVL